MKQIIVALLFILILAGCQNDRANKTTTRQEEIELEKKARQDFQFADDQIKKNNPAGILKLYDIATESISAEDSEIASEELRGYLYSKPNLWVSAISKVDITKFKKDFTIDFDTYRFTPEGEIPIIVAAKKIVSELKKMKGKNQQEQVLIDYLISYYSEQLKVDK